MTDSDHDYDDLWHTGDANRLETIRASLPPLLEQGETLVVDGRVHFKSPPSYVCPACGEPAEWGETTIEFQHAPQDQREQKVNGWVCPCGQAYVPGDMARAAHHRAMRDTDDSSDHTTAARQFVEDVGGKDAAIAIIRSLT